MSGCGLFDVGGSKTGTRVALASKRRGSSAVMRMALLGATVGSFALPSVARALPTAVLPDPLASDPQANASAAPEQGAGRNSAPDNSAPDNSAPDNSAPDNSAPDSSAPDNSAPDSSAPDNPAAQDPPSDNPPPEAPSPGDSSPENSAPSQPPREASDPLPPASRPESPAAADVRSRGKTQSPTRPPPSAVSPDSETPEFGDFESGHTFVDEDGDNVVVTVDRRKRDVQKVPASVMSISGEELTRRGVTSMREFTAVTPYVEVGAQEGNIELYIRGVGGNDNTEMGDPSVASHLDGVYIPRPRGLATMFYDVERVEVNFGPQGTLRGRNALGGTLNVIAKAPKPGEWEADAHVQFGSYDQRLIRGAVNVPLGRDVALRLAVFTERRDPFYENRGGSPLLRAAEDADTVAYRISGRWLPTEDVSVTVRFDNTRERGTGWTGSDYAPLMSSGIAPSEVPNPRAVAYVGNQPSQSLDHWGLSAKVEVDFGNVGLEVLSSYRDLDYGQHTGTSNGAFYYGMRPLDLDSYADSVWLTKSKSHVNEIRLFASNESAFRWTAGFFHFHEQQYVFLGQVQEDTSYGWLGRELNYRDVPSGSLAGYADATWDITEKFRTLAGFRFTSEYKERNGIGGGFTLQCNAGAVAEAQQRDPRAQCLPPTDPSFENGVRWGTPGFRFSQDRRTDFTAGGADDSLAGVADRVSTFTNGIESWGARDEVATFLAQPGADVGKNFVERRGNTRSSFPDFRLGAEWDVAPLSMVYLTFTTGHKSGGFNDAIDVSGKPRSYESSFGPETLYATEVGSKNVLLNKKLVLNGAAFWYAYQDFQLATVRQFGSAAQSSTVRSNVGSARVLGLQADVVGYLPKGFTGRLSMSVLDARFVNAEAADTRVSGNPDLQPQVKLDGKFLPRAPQLALFYGLTQNIATPIGYFDWSLSGQTKSTVYLTPFNGEGYDLGGSPSPLLSDQVPWTTRVDASAGYARTEGDIRFDVFVANLTNSTYMTSLVNAPGTNVRFFNTPRQVGVRVSLFL